MNRLNYPPEILGHQNYINDLSNSLASSISKQKDNIIFQVLKENNIDYSDLTELVKSCKFLKFEDGAGQIKYTTLNYNGRDLLMIYEPEITYENNKFKVEVKYKKLYGLPSENKI